MGVKLDLHTCVLGRRRSRGEPRISCEAEGQGTREGERLRPQDPSGKSVKVSLT